MKFKYEGFNSMGLPQTGYVEADSDGNAAHVLRASGIFAQKIEADDGQPMKGVFGAGSQNKTQVETVQTSKGGAALVVRTPPEDQPQNFGTLPWQDPTPKIPLPVPIFSNTHSDSVEPKPSEIIDIKPQPNPVKLPANKKNSTAWKKQMALDLTAVEIVLDSFDAAAKALKWDKKKIAARKKQAEEEMISRAVMAAYESARVGAGPSQK